MKDIGFILIKLFDDPMHNKVLDSMCEFIDNNPYNQYVLFNSVNQKLHTYNVPILHLSQAKFFDGDLFLFDYVSCLISKSFPNIKNKYFYAQDAWWANAPEANYTQWQSIIMDPSLSIIAKNKTIYDIYNICWKQPIGISENLKYEELKTIIV